MNSIIKWIIVNKEIQILQFITGIELSFLFSFFSNSYLFAPNSLSICLQSLINQNVGIAQISELFVTSYTKRKNLLLLECYFCWM